jgi:hypothetical protein
VFRGLGQAGFGEAVPPDLLGLLGQRRAALDAYLVSEPLRARGDQQHVLGQQVAHGPGDGDRVREPGHRGHRARVLGRPVHDRGVQLDLAQQVRQAAHAHVVIVLVGLRHPDGRLDRVHGAAAVTQDGHPGGQAHLAPFAGDQYRLGRA